MLLWLLLFILVAGSFLIGGALVLLWYFIGPNESRPSITVAAGVPFGCAALPIIGFVVLLGVSALLTKSDTQLYEEIFGYRPTIAESRMLFDDFGGHDAREIFMRAEPTTAERRKLMAIPGLAASGYRPEQFIARGREHGFGWWLSDQEDCKTVRILDARGFRGWSELRFAECIDAATYLPVGYVYVIASHRED
jgi:hypothetical protein